jgi:hypothetical protein
VVNEGGLNIKILDKISKSKKYFIFSWHVEKS